jgi:hypothetical protein
MTKRKKLTQQKMKNPQRGSKGSRRFEKKRKIEEENEEAANVSTS